MFSVCSFCHKSMKNNKYYQLLKFNEIVMYILS